MNEFVIRFADKNNTEAILKIYTPYVINTSITFEYAFGRDTKYNINNN